MVIKKIKNMMITFWIFDFLPFWHFLFFRFASPRKLLPNFHPFSLFLVKILSNINKNSKKYIEFIWQKVGRCQVEDVKCQNWEFSKKSNFLIKSHYPVKIRTHSPGAPVGQEQPHPKESNMTQGSAFINRLDSGNLFSVEHIRYW